MGRLGGQAKLLLCQIVKKASINVVDIRESVIWLSVEVR